MADTDPFVARPFSEQGAAIAGKFLRGARPIRISLAGRTETVAAGLDRIERALAS